MSENWKPEWRAWPSWQLIVRHPLRSIAVRFHRWDWLKRMDEREKRKKADA